jgi:DNA-binding XRE family transcriptional regulator
MDKYQQVWTSLEDEEYRREYSADVGTGLAFQIKLLREKKGWTQEKLADLTGRQQETISQWENPNYGSYTIKSLNSLAAAFDVALMVKFLPFSELVGWNTSLTPERLAPPSFTQEHGQHQIVSKSADLGSLVVTAQPSISSLTITTALVPDWQHLLEAYARGLNTVWVQTPSSVLPSEVTAAPGPRGEEKAHALAA